MSLLKSLTSVLTKRIDMASVTAVLNTRIDKSLITFPSSEVPQMDPKLNWRQMSLNGYKSESMPGRERRKFDLRYTAYGEVSSLYATHVIAKRQDKLRGKPSNTGSNAVTMEIDFSSEKAASLMLINDSNKGFASESSFSAEIDQLRRTHQGRIGELSAFEISRDNKSRRAVGALFHVLYLYARQARQMNYIFVRTKPLRIFFYEEMLGFSVISVRDQEVLMGIELSMMKREIRNWGGRHKDAEIEAAPFKMYPFFFPPQDEAGLLFRVLEHLGSVSDGS